MEKHEKDTLKNNSSGRHFVSLLHYPQKMPVCFLGMCVTVETSGVESLTILDSSLRDVTILDSLFFKITRR